MLLQASRINGVNISNISIQFSLISLEMTPKSVGKVLPIPVKDI